MRRLSIAWTLQLDANGNGAKTLVPASSYATSFIVSGDALGSADWKLYNNGVFQLPGAGSSVAIGPLTFLPAEQLTIAVFHGPANSTVQGSITGFISTEADGSDLHAALPLTSSNISSLPTSRVLLAYTTLPNGVAVGITPPTGTQEIIIDLVSADNGTLGVTGNATGNTYVSVTTTQQSTIFPSPLGPFQRIRTGAIDSRDIAGNATGIAGPATSQGISLTWTLSGGGATATKALVYASVLNLSHVTNHPTSPVYTSALAPDNTGALLDLNLPPGVAPPHYVTPVAIFPFRVSTAAIAIGTLAAGANLVVIPASNGVQVFIHRIQHTVQAASATFIDWQDTSGTQLLRDDFNVAGYRSWDGERIALPLSLGLQAHNGGINATNPFNGWVVYSHLP